MNALERYAAKPRRRVVGLMSGTSADGVDAALVEIEGAGEGTRVRLLAFKSYPYGRGIRERLFRAFRGEAGTAEIGRLNFELGAAFAEAARALLAGERVDLVASHGQTVSHLPPRDKGETMAGGKLLPHEPGSTLQLGEGAVIAERLGAPVVCDFRPADMAAGGQGAPLVPLADYVLFHSPEKDRVVQNLGGIANATALPAGGGLGEGLAFDTGPGNMVIDELVFRMTGGEQRYDRDGELAARGQVNERLLAWMLSHPFLRRRPPKSTGREEFGAGFVEELLERASGLSCSPGEALTTATAFTVEAIAVSYEQFILPRQGIDEIILGGGGSHNRTLVGRLEKRLPGRAVLKHEDFGHSSDGKEALAFAILGNETMLGRAGNLPAATGARHPAVLGKIVLPPPG